MPEPRRVPGKHLEVETEGISLVDESFSSPVRFARNDYERKSQSSLVPPACGTATPKQRRTTS